MSADNENNVLPVTKTERFNFLALLYRLVGIGLLSGSLGLIWWSFDRVFAPQLRHSREVNQSVAKLAATVDDLSVRCSTNFVAQVREQFKAAQSKTFAYPADLDAWLVDFRDYAKTLGLVIKTDYVRNSGAGAATNGLRSVAASFSIDFPDSTNSADSLNPYQRLLQLSRRLVTQGKSVDFTKLSVQSGPHSINHATLECRFWVAANDAK